MPSAYFEVMTKAIVLEEAIDLGSKVAGRGAVFTPSSQCLQAYLTLTCSITCTLAGIISSCSLICSPIFSSVQPQPHCRSSSGNSWTCRMRGSSLGSGFLVPVFLNFGDEATES